MPKQLSLSERIIIERMISKDYSFASIGRNLERSASTISREVIKYRCFVDRIPLPGENDCTHKNSCLKNSICDDVGVHGCYGYRCKRCPEDRICTNICASYESSQCPLLDKPPYVCTNCSILNNVNVTRLTIQLTELMLLITKAFAMLIPVSEKLHLN